MTYRKSIASIITILTVSLLITTIVPISNNNIVSASEKIYTDEEQVEYIADWLEANLDPNDEKGFSDPNYEQAWIRAYYNDPIYKIMIDAADEIKAMNLSDDETYKKIHDKVREFIPNYLSGGTMDWYEAIKTGSARCQGYANLFQMMCRMVGVPCASVRGVLNNGTNHMINVISLDDVWKYKDVTNSTSTATTYYLFEMKDIPYSYFSPRAIDCNSFGYHEFFNTNGTLAPDPIKNGKYVYITFKKVRGILINVVNSQQVGSTYELPKATAKGYTFKGWFTKASGKGTKITASKTITNENNHTLYAYWTAKKYKVTFNVNKGKKLKKSLRKKTVTYDKKYAKLPTPKKKGYKFKGWYTKKKGGKKITKSTKVKITKNTTLYARWKRK